MERPCKILQVNEGINVNQQSASNQRLLSSSSCSNSESDIITIDDDEEEYLTNSACEHFELSLELFLTII
jgi:hypothetical protein